MEATCDSSASLLGENAFFKNQSGKVGEWCGEAFLFYDKDVKAKDGITYLPHYMLPCLA